MPRKFKLTRLELKRQRDSLARYERYLPMLKLKQQQLQIMLRKVDLERRRAADEAAAARAAFEAYSAVLADLAGLDVAALARPAEVRTSTANVAGLRLPIFEGVSFAPAEYSLFATPPWVDRALADLRDLNRRQAELDVLDRQHALLGRELTRVIQRVNLFEKIMIPQCRDAIRVIRIALGDEMTAAVVRAKIAKGKLDEAAEAPDEHLPPTPVPVGGAA